MLKMIQEKLNKKSKNRIVNIAILFVFFLLYITVEYRKYTYECIVKKFFGISCPACGLTRAFYKILEFDFVSALKYNILAIPLFFFLGISIIWLIFDIIKGSNTYIKKIEKLFEKYYIAILMILGITMIINNI